MASQRFSSVQIRQLPSMAVTVICGSYIGLSLGLTFLMGTAPIPGALGLLGINFALFLFLRPHWNLPLYALVASPSLGLSFGVGIASRLYLGNIIMGLFIVIGFVRKSQHSSIQPLLIDRLLVPSIALACVGIGSIIYSRIYPDPNVIYQYRHSNISLTLVNLMEVGLLIGLPAVLYIMPALIRTKRDALWIIHSSIGIGLIYALGTIFAGPLRLYSDQNILGVQRPEIFGITSSILGMQLVFFACITLGQALYARERKAAFWWALTAIFSLAVILSFGRTAWIVLCLSILVMIGLRTKNFSVLPLILGMILLSFIPGVTNFFNPEKVYGADRLIMWQDAITIWRSHPFFGVGAGNYQFFDLTYGIDVGGIAHNQFLEVLAEMGIEGLLCLLWCLLAIGRLTFQRFRTARTEQGKAIVLTHIGYFTALLGLAFATDSFLPSVAGAGGTAALIIASYHWLLLGLVLTLPNWEATPDVQTLPT